MGGTSASMACWRRSRSPRAASWKFRQRGVGQLEKATGCCAAARRRKAPGRRRIVPCGRLRAGAAARRGTWRSASRRVSSLGGARLEAAVLVLVGRGGLLRVRAGAALRFSAAARRSASARSSWACWASSSLRHSASARISAAWAASNSPRSRAVMNSRCWRRSSQAEQPAEDGGDRQTDEQADEQGGVDHLIRKGVHLCGRPLCVMGCEL